MRTLLALLVVLGCSGCVTGPTERDLQQSRNRVAEAKIKLAEGEAAKSANLDVLRAELQLAELELSASKAKAMREQVAAGAHYAEVTTGLIAGPLSAAFPAAGPLLTGLAAGFGLLRKALSKKEIK